MAYDMNSNTAGRRSEQSRAGLHIRQPPSIPALMGSRVGVLLHECRERLAGLDDIGRQHPSGLGTEVTRTMRGPRRDQESVAGMKDDGGTSLDLHLDIAGDDVADLFAWMNVPSGFDADRNLRLHLNDLAARYR